MRILHVLPSFGLGGMEKIVCAIINNTLPFCLHELLTFDRDTVAGKWIKDNSVKYVELEKSNERGAFFRALYGALRKTRPDLLMTYNWGATDAIWLGRLAGIRRIIHNEHGFNVDEEKTTLWRRDAVRFLV